MTERVFFNKLITKNLTATDSEQRFFEGYLTVEMVDKQNEITIVDELMKVLPIWMSRGAPISDTHSNRIIGKGINYHKTYVTENGVEYPAIFMQGMIYKGMGYELDDEIWEKIRSGKYKGLSFGGATKSDRIPVTNKDGTTSYALKDLEHYEVAVCEEPAVPLALITQWNPVAKSMVEKAKGKYIQKSEKEHCIRCYSFGCYVDKTSVNSASPEIPVSDKSFQDTKIVDDSPQAEGLPDKNGEKAKVHAKDVAYNMPYSEKEKDGEWSDVNGRNKPNIDPPQVEKLHKPTAGKQNDPTGEDFEAVAHNAGQPSSGMNQEGADISNYGLTKTENEAFKPNEELLGAAGKAEEDEKDKTLNPGENLNMEKPIRGLRGTGGMSGNTGGSSMMAGAKSKEEIEKMRAIVAKFDYDMRGIINDPESHDPRKENKDKIMPVGIQASNSEDGVKGKLRTNDDEKAEAFDGSTGSAKGSGATTGGGTRGGSYETTDQGPQMWDARVTETGDHTRDVKRIRSGEKDSLNTINTAMKTIETAQKVAEIRRAVKNL